MARQIALLRGINLGSARRVPMARLREVLTDAGHGDVRTLLQSGNVVLTSGLKPDRLERELEKQIAAEFGFDVSVLVRTRDELADAIERDPLGKVADDPKRYMVNFLSGEPGPQIADALEAVDAGPDRFVISGREIYSWHPDGLARSDLAKALADRRLGVTATARNWNTVTKLLALADD
jgi:uncharacterized protein (DUF1697 family)